MSDAYHQLLDATIQHLEHLKSRGVRHITVAPETLRTLAQPYKSISAPVQPTAQVPKPALAPEISALVQPKIRNPKSELEKAAAFAELRERAMACMNVRTSRLRAKTLFSVSAAWMRN